MNRRMDEEAARERAPFDYDTEAARLRDLETADGLPT